MASGSAMLRTLLFKGCVVDSGRGESTVDMGAKSTSLSKYTRRASLLGKSRLATVFAAQTRFSASVASKPGDSMLAQRSMISRRKTRTPIVVEPGRSTTLHESCGLRRQRSRDARVVTQCLPDEIHEDQDTKKEGPVFCSGFVLHHSMGPRTNQDCHGF